MLRVTLDTNVVLLGLDGKDDGVLDSLKELHDSGRIEIAVSSRAIQDKLADPNPERLQYDLAAFNTLPRISAPARWGESTWGGLDVKAPEELLHIVDDLERLFGVSPAEVGKRQNTRRDVDHLASHWMAHHDLFLTNDKPILRQSERLADLGIKVMRPSEFLASLQGLGIP